MESDSMAVYNKRKEKIKNIKKQNDRLVENKESASPCIQSVEVEKCYDVLTKHSLQNQREMDEVRENIVVTEDEVNKLLGDLKSRWNEQQMSFLLGRCRSSVLASMAGPFGLGSVVAAFDKPGGNVTTVHNAENDVFANESDRKRYQVEFDRNDYEGGGLGPKRKELFQKQDQIHDAYKGTETPKDGRTHLDHVISAKEIHEDKWLRLSTDSKLRDDIATSKSNLVPTDSALNQSKNAKDLMEWMNAKRKDGTTNAEYFNVDKEKAKLVYDQAKSNFQVEKTLAVTKHLGKELCHTGSQEAAKMGLQQSFGLLLTEFFCAAFDEISDAYNERGRRK